MESINLAREAASVQEIQHLLIHILFTDQHKSDHHLILTLSVKANEAKDHDFIRSEAFKKADTMLKRIKGTNFQVLTDEQFQASDNKSLQPFYIIYQNGARKHCCIYAQNPDAAIAEFRNRFFDIHAYSIFGKNEGQNLKTTGEWKRIPLETHLN